MVRNNTQGPERQRCNSDRVNETIINVWKGADIVFVTLMLHIVCFPAVMFGALDKLSMCVHVIK